jgi:hypothetical protein
MLGNTPTQKCGDFQQFCKLWKPLENYLAALAWRRPRVRVSSGPLPFSFYLQVKPERKLQKPNTACGFVQQRSPR